MNVLRKIMGLAWILLAILAAWFCISIMGIPKFTSGKQDDLVFGIVVLFVLTPIIVGGLFLFGWFAWKNEYERS